FVNPATRQALLLDHRDLRQPVSVCLCPLHQGTKCPDAPYQGLLRFMADTPEDLAHACRTLDRLLNKEFAEDSIQTKGRHRNWHDVDPTVPRLCRSGVYQLLRQGLDRGGRTRSSI
ncbi:MAG: hypothetical protein U5K27_14865, partial [Desulfotignum sp.]|nr:hypothetical protein [Desulfotignum sp.]